MTSKQFECVFCNYKTERKHDYDKHILTKKHLKAVTEESTPVTTGHKYRCNICNTTYKHLKSLLRHTKTDGCNTKLTSIINNSLLEKIEENTKQNDILAEQLKELNSAATAPVVHNTTINNTMITNKININLFLNSEYKDALTIDQFKEQLKLTLDDLLYTKNNGYAKGITNILIKNLEELGPSKRPIHYSDDKSNQFYICDNNSWVEDKDPHNIDNTINNVAQAQIKKIKEWEAEHPDWNASEHGQNEYIDIIKSVMGSTSAEQQEKDNKQIKNKIKTKIEIPTTSSNLIEYMD